jgi:hypothetical protein
MRQPFRLCNNNRDRTALPSGDFLSAELLSPFC